MRKGKLVKLLSKASDEYIVGLFNIMNDKRSISKKYLKRACAYLEEELIESSRDDWKSPSERKRAVKKQLSEIRKYL